MWDSDFGLWNTKFDASSLIIADTCFFRKNIMFSYLWLGYCHKLADNTKAKFPPGFIQKRTDTFKKIKNKKIKKNCYLTSLKTRPGDLVVPDPYENTPIPKIQYMPTFKMQ